MPFIRRSTLNYLKQEIADLLDKVNRLTAYIAVTDALEEISSRKLEEMDAYVLYLSQNVPDYEKYVLDYMEKTDE